jgi:hypothetical protein
MIKPESLLLPPSFVYDLSFHQDLVCLDYLQYPFPSGEYHLWFTVLSKVLRDRICLTYISLPDDKKIRLVKDFCDNVKGLFSYYKPGFIPKHERRNIISSLLFLEGMAESPINFIEESFIDDLKTKYNYLRNDSIIINSIFYIVLDTYEAYA